MRFAAAFALLGLAACQAPATQPTPAPAADVAPANGPAQVGVASYVSPELAGEPTASGEPHRPDAMTAASRTLPLGASAKVTNTETGASAQVRINDRGPYAKGRILDVSPKAAERLGMKDDGVAKVKVEPMAAPED